MKHHLPVIVFLVSIQPALAQGLLDNSSRLNVTGDAAVNVEPDRVRILLGVESRNKALLAAKNHVYDVEFSTSELRKHRDAARALAVKAAQQKAADLAAAAGLRVVGTPLAVGAYSYGGGASYGRWHGLRYGQSQNVVQNAGSAGDGIGAEGTVALGKISVTAAVSMTFQLQP